MDSHDELRKQLVQVRKYLGDTNRRIRLVNESCKKTMDGLGFDKKELEFLRSNIMPLVESALAKKNDKQKIDFLNIFNESVNDINRGVDYATEVLSIENVGEKQRSILNLYAYLSISEGIYSEAVQLLSFLLLENSHDLYDPRRMRFAKVYADLDKIDMFVKLQFLEEHRFKSVVRAFDRKLRNDIAHQKVIVEDNGDVVNPVTHMKIADKKTLLDKIKKLVAMSSILTNVIASEFLSSRARLLKEAKLQIEKTL